ncbi:MAG TPA: tripartite tricarboxylate transporter substrate binding protein [Usitatibacter sp.]|jgi:tripartite-type tricarboxylate transporter receptor subunit TctC|nr:tripartite tricarboxylate transporter substrate binding protein [Usitatibacter sp.]
MKHWLAALLCATACAAFAEAPPWPSRPVTIVVPYPPGGSNDTFARELGKRLSDEWKIPVLVDNHAGAGGSVGAGMVARAAPDGYTLCLLSSSFTTNAAVQKNLPFDPVNGFAPVAMVARGPMLLTVSNQLPVKTTLELFALARREPGKLNYASSGQGSTNHFATELLMEAAKIRMTHIPYKGMGPAVTDVIAGHVDVLIASAPSIYQQVKAGKVKGLGVTSLERSSVVPDLAPVAQMGAPGYSFELWWGILAPKGTPPDTVARINSDVNRILATQEMRETLLREGTEPAPMSAAAFAATIRREIDGWKKVAHDANIQAE